MSMHARELSIAGAWEISPPVHRGADATFVEAYSADTFATTIGAPMSLGQLNFSVLARGTMRGIHFGDVPPGQSKYVTCVAGAVWDVAVDLRVGSPTFGCWDAVVLDPQRRNAIYLAEGLGHGYLSLAEGSVLAYVCSQPYIDGNEHRVDALDPDLAIAWPATDPSGCGLCVSRGKHDSSAPRLHDLREQGALPKYPQVLRLAESPDRPPHAESETA